MTNSFTVRKKVKVTETVTKIKTIDMIDWSKVPNGTYMTAKINGMLRKGAIFKQDTKMWFCQNGNDGDSAPHKLGFKHSWKFDQNENGSHGDVTDIKFPPKPANVKILLSPPTTIRLGFYNAKINKDSIEVGCQTFSKAEVKAVWEAMNEIN
jgi:hypothetical protein